MEFLYEKFRALRPTKSSKYRNKSLKETIAHSSPSASPASRRTASPKFIEKVFLGRPIIVNHRDEEGVADFHDSEFVLDCLKWHNIFREKHGVPPLKLSQQLCNMAQFWANHLAHTNTFYHRNIKDIGENLFSKLSYLHDFDITGEMVTKYWYNEIKTYNFYQDPSLLHVYAGQFTQMVWRSTTEFGVGKARSRNGKIVVVATYKPVGNVNGEFQDNVYSSDRDIDRIGSHS